MIATIYTLPGCDLCREEKTLLYAEGYAVTEISVHEFGDMPPRALAQLALQNERMPVIEVNGEFKKPAFISNLLEQGEMS